MLPPPHKTGPERYSPSFREPSFSETRLPAYPVLGIAISTYTARTGAGKKVINPINPPHQVTLKVWRC